MVVLMVATETSFDDDDGDDVDDGSDGGCSGGQVDVVDDDGMKSNLIYDGEFMENNELDDDNSYQLTVIILITSLLQQVIKWWNRQFPK